MWIESMYVLMQSRRPSYSCQEILWEMSSLNLTPRVALIGPLGLLCFCVHSKPLRCVY